MSEYSELFKNPKWQKMRLKILERDDWGCQSCLNNGENDTLHIHHRRYINGRKPWEYPESLLVTLCETCHKVETENLQDACDSLIEQIKEKFFSNEIRLLAQIINGLVLNYPSEVCMEIIEFALLDTSAKKAIDKLYWKKLHRKNQQKIKKESEKHGKDSLHKA